MTHFFIKSYSLANRSLKPSINSVIFKDKGMAVFSAFCLAFKQYPVSIPGRHYFCSDLLHPSVRKPSSIKPLMIMLSAQTQLKDFFLFLSPSWMKEQVTGRMYLYQKNFLLKAKCSWLLLHIFWYVYTPFKCEGHVKPFLSQTDIETALLDRKRA